VASVFRLADPIEGAILIDGIDIKTIELDKLRSSISIIPQDPTLFIGTVRYNLDPFDNYSDKKIWKVLEIAQLKEYIKSTQEGLEAPVHENGSNFSAGQKQLICLARALLKKSKILVLDEATASVDYETDMLIQKTVREQFKKSTVLTVAHRLNTVMDYDKILVLDKGEIAEFDIPKKLLDNENGVLTSMVNATGHSSAKYLKQVANGEIDVLTSLLYLRKGKEFLESEALKKISKKKGGS